MTIEQYTVDSCPGWVTDDIHEARTVAMRDESRLIAHTFEWSDSELIEDHTPADLSACPS